MRWYEAAGLGRQGLFDLYQEKTDKEIAATYGVTDASVLQARRGFGIPSLTMRERRELVNPPERSLSDLTPSALADLYNQMGDVQIAKIFGVAKPAIQRLRRRWGIAPLSKADRSVIRSVAFTAEQKEICIGTVLGDGHILSRGVLKVAHSINQLTYTRRMHSLLSPHTRPMFYEEKRMRDSGALTFGFGFCTVQHPWLAHLREVFYPYGVKVFPDDVLRNLTARSLAYWYFDDGHLADGLPSIALGDFTTDEAQRIIETVRDNFYFDAYQRVSSSTCKVFRLRARSADSFYALIRDYATPDMFYKLPPHHRPIGVSSTALITPVTVPLSPDLPQSLRSRSKQWTSLGNTERRCLVKDVVGYWRGQGFPHSEAKVAELFTLSGLEQAQVIQGGVIKARQVGQALCHAFCPHIWKARNWDGTLSPMAIFQDDRMLGEALRRGLDADYVPNGAQVRRAVRYYKRSGVYNFRPSAAKVLVDRYCIPGGVVWDPCAGYGGRMLGTVLSKQRPQYVACDPQPETYVSLLKFQDWLDDYVPGVTQRISLHNIPAEDFNPPDVDMVMTSPPYWKKEMYGDGANLAGNRYPTYEAWLSGFWVPVLQKAADALKPGGWLVLNVDDFKIGRKEYSLIRDTLRVVEGTGVFEKPETYIYAMPIGKDQENAEKVFCWVKRGVPEGTSTGHQGAVVVSAEKCVGCGGIFPSHLMEKGRCVKCVATPVKRLCKGCGKEFEPTRADHEFHSKNCHARWRRREYRKTHPAKKTRTFVCVDCGRKWQTELLGHFTRCLSCAEIKKNHARDKLCQYHKCRRPFHDNSPKNSMQYCHPEHRRREKLFRLGQAPEKFRKDDPVLG